MSVNNGRAKLFGGGGGKRGLDWSTATNRSATGS